MKYLCNECAQEYSENAVYNISGNYNICKWCLPQKLIFNINGTSKTGKKK